MAAGAVAEPLAGTDVGRKRKPGEPSPKRVMKQFALRLPLEIAARVEDTAATLGLDEANLLRHIVIASLPTYEKKAERVKAGQPVE